MTGTSPRSRSLALRRSAGQAALRGAWAQARSDALRALDLVSGLDGHGTDERHARDLLAWIDDEMAARGGDDTGRRARLPSTRLAT